MKVLIQRARITDPGSPFNESTKDILIESGTIREIANDIPESADKIINIPGLCISPGWVDIFTNFSDPGYEFKETIETGSAAAANGGFTDVFVIPNTKPVIDSKSMVEYIRNRSNAYLTNVYPIAAVTKNAEGKDLAEMYDMHATGAVAFSDGLNPIQSAGVLVKALQYVKAINGVIIQIPDDKTLGTHGLMNEGIISTRLGLAGKPMMAEELLVARDIKLARYTESRLHITGVTSPKSLEYIRRAKQGGIDVTCSMTPYHLYFSDEDMESYDTNLKVFPPLRGKQDIEAMKAAVMDGTIDCISSHHMPHEFDSKVVEFEYAKYGMIGIETSFLVLKNVFPLLTNDKLVQLLSSNARKIFGLPACSIDKNNTASITLYTSEGDTEINTSFFKSRSRNSPFIGQRFQGSVLGIINRNQVFLKN